MHYANGTTHNIAFGFRFLDGTQTPWAQGTYAPHDITVVQDGCASNGGEGGTLANATLFDIRSLLVPVINVYTNDTGDPNERFGSPLTQNPAWLR